MSSPKIIRLPEVIQRTGLSRSTIYLLVSKNKFPQHIPLGLRCVGWLESEISEWIESRSMSRSQQ